MAFYILGNFDVGDYDSWKERFDADPAGRTQSATGHVVSCDVDNPSNVFVRVEFSSAEDARSFRERLLESGALDPVDVKVPPTVVEVVDEARY